MSGVSETNGNVPPATPLRASVEQPGERPGLAQLIADVVELGELQLRLLMTDLRATIRRVALPIVASMVGAVVILGSIPVLLASLADVLVELAGWPWWAALLTIGGAGTLLGIIILGVAYFRLRRAAAPLGRTTSELAKNMASLRELLTTSDDARRPNKPR